VDTQQLADSRYIENEVYREQITSADALYMSKTDAMTATERAAVRAELQALRSAPVVFFDESEPFNVEMLDIWSKT
jgi:G3E family GTPase